MKHRKGILRGFIGLSAVMALLVVLAACGSDPTATPRPAATAVPPTAKPATVATKAPPTAVPPTATRVPDATPVVLKASSAWPTTSTSPTMFIEWIKEVNRRAGGALVIDYVGGPEVVHPFEGFPALRSGIVDIVHTAAGYFSGEVAEGGAFSMTPAPPALSPQDIADLWYQSGALEILNEVYEQKSGVRSLGLQVGGQGFGFIMVDKIDSLAGLKGKRIRVWDAMGAGIVEAAGAVPQTLPASELYTALQRGTVAGALRSPPDAWSQGEKDVYQTILRPAIFSGMGGGFISAKAWNSLPKNLQDLIMNTSYDMTPSIVEWYIADEEHAVAEFAKASPKVEERFLSTEEWKVLFDGHQKHWDTMAKRSPVVVPKVKAAAQPWLDKAMKNLGL